MNETLHDLYRQLADGALHSGQQLACRLGVSRSAIWKQVRQLEQCGLPITHQARSGYRLAFACEPLDADRITAALAARHATARVDVAWHLSSTSDRARQLLQQGHPQAVVACEWQTAGRGRRGRHWHSLPGASLVLSVGAVLAVPMQALAALPLKLGLAVAHSLAQQGYRDVRLKWPNDLVTSTDGRLAKIGGLLLEVDGELEGPVHLVAGLGLNLCLPPFPLPKHSLPAANLPSDQPSIPRNALTAELAHTLLETLQQGVNRPFASQCTDYDRLHALHQRQVKLLQNSHESRGRVLGVDDRGCLLLQQGATTRRFAAGEIRLRPDEHAAD